MCQFLLGKVLPAMEFVKAREIFVECQFLLGKVLLVRNTSR